MLTVSVLNLLLFSTQAPVYFRVIHGWSVEKTGLFSGIPHLLRTGFSIAFSHVGDYLLSNSIMSRTNVRKLATFFRKHFKYIHYINFTLKYFRSHSKWNCLLWPGICWLQCDTSRFVPHAFSFIPRCSYDRSSRKHGRQYSKLFWHLYGYNFNDNNFNRHDIANCKQNLKKLNQIIEEIFRLSAT